MTEENSESPETSEPDFDELPDGDGVLVISKEGSILAGNLQAEKIFRSGFKRGEFLKLGQVINAQYLPQAEEALREALNEGHSRSNLVATVRLTSGLPVSVTYSIMPLYDMDDKITGVVLTFRDNNPVSSKAAFLGPLSNVEYDDLFENLAEGVFTIDRRWRITSFNKRAQEITGYNREEVLGRNCWNIFKSDLCQSSCPLKTTLETGVMRMDQDVRIAGKYGKRLSILVNTSVLKNKDDEVLGAVETFRPLISTEKSGQVAAPATTGVSDIIGKSSILSAMLKLLPDIASSEASVVLEGESGTGKELVARAIHNLSPRSDGPFVAVNCSALTETLLESELFGHEKAAFTGAINSKVGRFELARGGTLFLDEVGEIKPDIQVKLLRVLEERVFERVGGIRPISMDARLIAATNRNLIQDVRQGRFREDLYYRLRTIPLTLPPLRQRVEDIPLLVNHFVSRLNAKYQKNVRGLDPKVMALLAQYHWPGNIRELQHLLEYAFVFVKGPVITIAHLPKLQEAEEGPTSKAHPNDAVMREDELQGIIKALEKSGGRRDHAAKSLGISRSTLWRKMKDYRIT
ncbi:PAS modulated sigma54 specific transcriptional regulator, Fis family [uncultured Desulfobacterium sp.]|uniref:PAS modulated sigma54 specific transcriptional regulator, Fis family n=1 Tax=uncultured Desulfobacterium sp. TaxID=201089 RepID=A0A445MR46_9BACT|nr:PAS modulated sigma54 specific transcriptional regulator, Fis family [uncultured Desulfobacterium sp.]